LFLLVYQELRAQIEELTSTEYISRRKDSLDDSLTITQSYIVESSNIPFLENLNERDSMEEEAAMITKNLAENNEVDKNCIDISSNSQDVIEKKIDARTFILTNSLKECRDENIRLNDKLAEIQRQNSILRRNLDDYNDLEDLKVAFEEYETQHRQELEDDIAKIESEKEAIQLERQRLAKDKSSVDEKESRVGLLINNLDEKDSKLRQLLGTIKEQQEQWQRSITDLQRREDLVVFY
jgi:DNA repair exonuclease SbcCD ATPase subunit